MRFFFFFLILLFLQINFFSLIFPKFLNFPLFAVFLKGILERKEEKESFLLAFLLGFLGDLLSNKFFGLYSFSLIFIVFCLKSLKNYVQI